jgi:signal peptidase II
MPKLNSFPVKWTVILCAIAAVIIASDQWTKRLIQNNFYPGQSMPETGFFRLTYAQNTGAAFSIFWGGNDVLAIFSMAGIALILFFYFYLMRRYSYLNTAFTKISVALILGGTAGNLVDRLSLHYVRDFIDVGPWPIFNIADSSTVVGTILFAISILFFTRDWHTTQPSSKTDSAPQPPAKVQ